MRVSGAGSALYRLFDDRESACRVASEIEELEIGTGVAVVAAPVGAAPLNIEEYTFGTYRNSCEVQQP
jgi:4-diphosphocytidyl-2C-methyl-D-erythritol kinase